MLVSLRQVVGVCAALALCMPAVAVAHALPVLRAVPVDGHDQDTLTMGQATAGPLESVEEEEVDAMMADDYADGDVAYGNVDYEVPYADEDAVMRDGTSFRKLLHGCHNRPQYVALTFC